MYDYINRVVLTLPRVPRIFFEITTFPNSAHPLGASPVLWAPCGPPPLIPAPTHSFFLPKNHQRAQTRVLAHLAAVLTSLLKASLIKLLWGIVLRYVTPPMVQLVFVLMLYSLQIFVA